MVMKNKSIFIVFLFILLSASCNTKKEQPSIEMETEIIDFSSFEIIKGSIPEAIIKEKKYILLNSSDSILFGRIDKIKIIKDIIYILDTKLRELIVFNLSGVGIGKIGGVGQGPKEYIRITDFDINDSGDIYFIDGTSDKLFVFDKNLQFVSAKKMPFEADIIQCLPGDKLLFGLSSWNKGDNASMRIAITNLELETEMSCMQYDEYIDNAYGISDYTFINTGDCILYNKPIDNYVYEFSLEGQLRKAYFFDFGKKNVPNEYKKDIEGNLEKFEHYCCIKNFAVVNDKYMLGTLWDGAKTKTFVVDKNNKTAYLSKKEIADADNSNISGFYDNQIISYIYPGKYDDIQATDFPADVKKHVEDENFVVCLYTLK
jgi:hypothetical protein